MVRRSVVWIICSNFAEKFSRQASREGSYVIPYVAPVIAVAFSWIVLFDPFSGALNALLIQMDVVKTPINFLAKKCRDSGFWFFILNFPLTLTMVILFELGIFSLSFLFHFGAHAIYPSDI